MMRGAAAGAIAAIPSAGAEWTNTFAREWRDMFLKHWESTKHYTMEIFDAMPPEHFDSRPVPEQRSFGEQMAHLGSANVAYMRAFGVVDAPPAAAGKDRDSVRKYVTATFDYVTEVLKKLEEPALSRKDLKFSARLKPHSGSDLFMRAYMHTAHHRGQAVVYLRVKGIVPPAWEFEPTA